MSDKLRDEEVETIYAAYDTVMCWEAKSIEGKRKIVTPIYDAVIRARVETAQRYNGGAGMAVALDDYYRARHTKDPEQVRRATTGAKRATLETIRRYNAGEITERQACDWFGVDRLTLRAALAQPSEPGLDVERLARAIASVKYEADPEDADRRFARRIAAEYARLASEPTEFMRDPENHTQEADGNGVWCRACQQSWPCDTIRALHDALASEPTDERA